MSTDSTGGPIRYALGGLLMVGGIACVVWGFATFTGSALDGSGSGAGRSMALFAGGGLATVVGFGLIAFTRVGSLARGGAYTRVTVEQGFGSSPGLDARAGAGSHCTSCGAAVGLADRFCGSCGVPLDPTTRR